MLYTLTKRMPEAKPVSTLTRGLLALSRSKSLLQRQSSKNASSLRRWHSGRDGAAMTKARRATRIYVDAPCNELFTYPIKIKHFILSQGAPCSFINCHFPLCHVCLLSIQWKSFVLWNKSSSFSLFHLPSHPFSVSCLCPLCPTFWPPGTNKYPFCWDLGIGGPGLILFHDPLPYMCWNIDGLCLVLVLYRQCNVHF